MLDYSMINTTHYFSRLPEKYGYFLARKFLVLAPVALASLLEQAFVLVLECKIRVLYKIKYIHISRART